MKKNMSVSFLAAMLTMPLLLTNEAQGQSSYVTFQKEKNSFTLSASGKSTSIYISPDDFPGVLRAVRNLQIDIEKVTSKAPALLQQPGAREREMVIIGTVDKSELIGELVNRKKIDITSLKGKWESFLIQLVENPFPNVERALVIAGSDKRGTIFGIYDVAKEIGVSPWYWWADVPVSKHPDVYIKPGKYLFGEPAVKYRGIFINDEEPALGRWAVEKYGGFKHEMYEKVFELILRMKGNYLWPAMWWASFNTDDPLNPDLADEYGIVMSTTHHEPMMRAHADWKAYKGSAGPWDYDKNETKLREFWTEGIRRMGSRESIVSMGMRGDGDMAMTAETNIALLERIVAAQRKIIADVSGKPPEKTPQLWALYKEVQDYYDRGMRVPDDVTLLLCDDNWGNIRKLPKLTDAPRSGGYGIYYHFDYVGGPRNYKWVNTSHLSRVREQMNMALQYGADRIWVVNVGDIKPMELPIEFFLDFAWDPKPWGPENIKKYTTQWAARQFGERYAGRIAYLLSKYTKYNSRRKPELLSAETYSLVNYLEAETVVAEYNKLSEDAKNLYKEIPAEFKDAYFQLVLYPIQACAYVNELWVTVGKNRLYAKQGRAITNRLADQAQTLFMKDSVLRYQYNDIMAKGKWHHMMDQNHISYTYWQQPEKDVLPEVNKIELVLGPAMGVAVEGSEEVISKSDRTVVLPSFHQFNNDKHYVDIINKGNAAFNFSISTDRKWIKPDISKGKVASESRIWLEIDWVNAPLGKDDASVTIKGSDGQQVTLHARIDKIRPLPRWQGFVENDGYVSMEGSHFTKAVGSNSIKWEILSEIGRTLDGVAVSPVTANTQTPGGNSPHLEYQFYLSEGGDFKVQSYFSPTLNFNVKGLRYAVSIDDEKPQIVNIHEDFMKAAWDKNPVWDKWVADNIIIKTTQHNITAGTHTLKYWMVDPGVVLQKIVIGTDKLRPSYLGPPESARVK